MDSAWLQRVHVSGARVSAAQAEVLLPLAFVHKAAGFFLQPPGYQSAFSWRRFLLFADATVAWGHCGVQRGAGMLRRVLQPSAAHARDCTPTDARGADFARQTSLSFVLTTLHPATTGEFSLSTGAPAKICCGASCCTPFVFFLVSLPVAHCGVPLVRLYGGSTSVLSPEPVTRCPRSRRSHRLPPV